MIKIMMMMMIEVVMLMMMVTIMIMGSYPAILNDMQGENSFLLPFAESWPSNEYYYYLKVLIRVNELTFGNSEWIVTLQSR